MKEKSKKIISIAIVLFMVLNYFVPVINYAEGNTKEGTEEQTETEEISREYEIKETEEWDISEKQDKSVIAKWNLADKSITISGKGNMKDRKYNSTEDWHGKYKNATEKVIINNGITNIGEYAFYEYSSLTEITIPNSVTSIEDSAFSGCSSLKEITIPSSVTSIEYLAFDGCSSLEEITIPSSVTSISYSAFRGCSSLKEIKVSSENKNYTSINGVLYNKDKTKIIAYPANKLGEKYIILNSVTSIEWNAFYGCSSLKEITIPSSVTSIGERAFYGCSSLEEITIPNSVISIGKSAFYGCKYIICKTNSYAHKYAEENKVKYKLLDNEISQYTDLYEIKETEEWDISEKQDKSVIAKWNLADGSITISGKGNMKSFKNNSTEDWHGKYKTLVEKVIINNGITNIGKSAFYECSSLKEITIPNSVASIGFAAFEKCSSLKEITIPEGVTSINDCAFCECSSLKEITIPNSVTNIDYQVFYGCSSLKEIKVSGENKNYTSIDGVLYNKKKTKIIRYPANKPGEKYIILDSVTSIEEYAFSGCSSLKEITIPSSVTSIERGAFYGCSSLEEIAIPSSVTSIEQEAFLGCRSLKKITIPNTVTSIGIYTFKGCRSLKEITIPSSVTIIRYGAFYGCSSLKEITVPNSVTSIGSYAFKGSSNLKEIIIPSSVTSIESYAFDGVKYIICKTNSYAHRYAEENKVPYKLDEKPPEIKVEYSITKLTNQNVIATITSNEKLQEVVGWTLSEDKKTLTKEYEKNAEEEIIVKDLVGNEVKQAIKVANIVQATGDVTKDGVVNIGDLLKLKQHMAYEQNETTRAKHANWKLDEEKVLIGDVNKNGKIDVGDILKLRRYIAASTSKEIAEKHSGWLNL